MTDKDRPVRPRTSFTPQNSHRVLQLILSNLWISQFEISEKVRIGVVSVIQIIQDLDYCKICAWWIPYELSEEQKQA